MKQQANAINRIIRQAVKDAIFLRETKRMREAYRLQPDSVEASDTWDLPEDWKE